MQGNIITISGVLIKITHDQNLIFIEVSKHTFDYMHAKAELNDLVEQTHAHNKLFLLCVF